jgi:diaminopimelate decarboxylase
VNIPVHAPIAEWAVADDCLLIGGIPLPRLAQRVGRTPFYAYDRALLDKRAARVRDLLPQGVRLHYAIKANPMAALVCHMAALVDGLDVASAGELKIALDSGISPEEVSFAGPAKSDAELKQAVAAGVLINVESAREIHLLKEIARGAGVRPRVAIRVNPDFELKSSGMKMGGGPKQFGVDVEQVPAMLADLVHSNLNFEGFHVFSGSQNLRAEAIGEAQEKAVDLVLSLAEPLRDRIKVVNIGGGFGIPYFPGDKPLDLAPIATTLSNLMPRVRSRLPHASVVIELGRYLVGEAGVYVCRIIERKISRGETFLVTDGGLHHHLAASGNFGQTLRKNYPVVIGNRVRGNKRESASVVGPLCTPLDLLADRMDLAHAEEGDFVVIFQSGAYGFTASPSAFLSHPPALEVLV